jgi:3-phosphoshikimate 1-carboxyvinyltransferase
MKVISTKAKNGVEGRIRSPPSKSYTHRAIFASSLASGTSEIEYYLLAGDTLSTIRACKAYGARIEGLDKVLFVYGVERPKTPENIIDVENSGTTLRIATSILGNTDSGFSILTGDESIRERPMQPLIASLSKIGVKVWSARGNGSAPLIVRGGGIRGGETEIDGTISSQFISSILICSPLSKRGVRLEVREAVSRPYIDSTVYVLQKFSIRVEREGYSFFEVEPQDYKPCKIKIPGDYSSSSFLIAACALAGGRLTIDNLDNSHPQADKAIVDILQRAGIKIKISRNSLLISSDGSRLRGFSIDLRDCPDLLPIASVLALRADSEVKIRGVKHARFKETDRIHTIAKELSKVGVRVKEFEDGLSIGPTTEFRSAVLNPHKDHRLFMAFLVASLLDSKVSVVQSDVSLISYPTFISDIQKIGVSVESREI